MKNVRRISNKYYLRQIVSCWLMCYMLFCFGIPAQVAMATPNGGAFQVGTGTIVDCVQNSTVLVNQMESIIHWNGLDTSSIESLSFNQMEGLSNAAVLNRVVGEGAMSATQFNGALNGAGMRIFVVNPAGIIFGKNAVINVSQLVASSLKIDDADFLNGAPYNFYDGGLEGTGKVSNAGTITATDGLIALIGKTVTNTGTIVAENGYVVLAAGDTVILSESGSNVAVAVTMPKQEPGSYDYRINNEDDGSVDAQHIILAAGDIYSTAYITASANGGTDAAATVDIDAMGNVEVTADDWDEAVISAEAAGGTNNTATINISAGGDVMVKAENGGKAKIEAIAMNGENNTATVNIDAGGDVKVIAEGWGSGPRSYASIEAIANGGIITNTADVAIDAGGDVLVTADRGKAYIGAEADGGLVNIADVLICTEGRLDVLAGVREEYGPYLTMGYGGGGFGGGSWASINATAHCDYTNMASVGIGAEDGVLVKGMYGGYAEILAGAYDGFANTAETIVCTNGDLWVVGNGGYAYIGSKARNGDITDAYTGVCAEGDIIVVAGFDPQDIVGCQIPEGMGGEAFIYSEAAAGYKAGEDSTADARTVAVSKKGSVGVGEITGEGTPDTAGITAEAHNAYKNTASVGVAAGADLSPATVASIKGNEDYEGDGFMPPGDVYVMAFGDRSNARIMAKAYNGYENTADTVVCAPGEVLVTAIGDGSEAKIKSLAENGDLNKATTQVYASEVTVDVPDRRGNGISALADGSEPLNVGVSYCLTENGAVALTDGGSTLIVDTYANRKDCPECPPCPCEQDQPVPPPPPAPLNAMRFSDITERVPEISGCPAIVAAATEELGITPESIQVAMANSMASASDIQPCDTCARLISAAAILKDADGSRMAALIEAINAIAPANVPFTPEIGTQIATVFEDHKGDDTAYASALEYVDAFVEYVKILDNEMGSPVGDSVVFALEKHGQTLTASDNANIAAFVASRLEQIAR